MNFFGLDCPVERIAAPLPIHRANVDTAQWSALALAVAEAKGRLVSLWGSDERAAGAGFTVSAAYATTDGLLWAKLGLDPAHPTYPDISRLFPPASRMQRAARDLVGIEAEDVDDTHPWLRHGAWPADYFPLRMEHTGQERFEPQDDPYPFVPVEGDGVHEIPVGPVHAGTIEPGHFRFSVVGEKVLRLEERLGFAHKGIEKRAEGLDVMAGARLLARTCGDSAAAYAWAYAMAVEAVTGTSPTPRALVLRGLLLERERIANHVGDIGGIANDAGFAFGLVQCSRLKEDLLRVNARVWGQRYPFDAIVPGGVRDDVDADAVRVLLADLDALEAEL